MWNNKRRTVLVDHVVLPLQIFALLMYIMHFLYFQLTIISNKQIMAKEHILEPNKRGREREREARSKY